MKNTHLALAVVAALASTSLSQAELFSENFQSGYVAGNLTGQNDWANGFATPTPSATVTLDSGNYFVASVDNSYSIKDVGLFGLTVADTITLTFDLQVTAASANAMFGIGNYSETSSSAGTPAVFGVQSGFWTVRGYGFQVGTSTIARDSNAIAIAPTLNQWYRVQSTWDLSGSGTGTLSIMNLTLGETDFTQLYFNAAQTQATADLDLLLSWNPGVADWDGVFFRTQNGAVDNLTAVPEPQTVALIIVAGLAFVLVLRRRAGVHAA